MTASETPRSRRFAARLLRDPLLHFIVAGVAIFSTYQALSPAAKPSTDPMRIELTKDDMKQLALVQLAQGLPLPDPDQLLRLGEERALRRILAREAVSFGLDRDDEIVERRLAQKMDFLLADLSQLNPPGQEELATWYAAHADQFTQPARASFRHVYFSPDNRGDTAAEAAATAALPGITGRPPTSSALAEVGDRFMFQDYYGGRTEEEVGKDFGSAFASALFAIKPGAWSGPIRSGYGWHLVYIDTLVPARVPILDEVEADVRAAWTDERYKEIRQRAEDEMRARYTVFIPTLAPSDLDDLDASKAASLVGGGL